MKGYGFVISALIFLTALVSAALGADWVLGSLKIISKWALAWPPPNEHFASMIGALGWPIAILWIVWLLRRPLRRAALLLAERMKGDNLKFGGFLEITRTDFNTMDRRVAVEHVEAAPAVGQSVDIAESLLEYAGVSDDNAMRLLTWVDENYGSGIDPEAFLTEPEFADARQQAYMELIVGIE